ncbi:MAG TPA: hypothetical protein VHC04_20690, partial [Rhodopila sp.]|nr:hypothetical protein [Rhodopila sp.]
MSVPARVSEHLFASFITRLTPLFAIGTTDLALAEAQAVELVNGFGIRSAWDLFSVARIVGLGMASLASIELSARPDLSAAFAVRCRSNADALHRTAERSEHRLRKQQGEGEAATPRRSAPDRAAISATLQAVAETRRRLDQAKAELTAPEPVPKLSGPEPPGLEPMGPEPVPKPSGPEPPGLELMGPEPVPKPSGPEPPGLELMGPEPMGLEPMGSEEAGLQPAGPGLVKTALAERTGAGPAEAEQTRARLAKPRP